MNKYFVYYEDDFADNGGLGLESFEDVRDALSFIEDRIREEPEKRKVSDYALIFGKKLDIEAYETVTKIKISQ